MQQSQTTSINFDTTGVKKSLRSKFDTLHDWKQDLRIPNLRKKKLYICDDLFNRTSRSRKSRDAQPNVSANPNDIVINIEELRRNAKRRPRMLSAGLEDAVQMKLKRRERLKKQKSPFEIVRHYVCNEQFEPSQQQMQLLERFFKHQDKIQRLLKANQLPQALEIVYDMLTVAIDLNQMNFFCLLVDFIAQMSFHMEDYNKAFYFYEQSRLTCSYNSFYELKIDSLLGMASIASKLKLYKEALIFLKKALQYAWHVDNKEKELTIYDNMGIVYFYLGNLQLAQYFHSRFAQGACESADSAVKLISAEILNEYSIYIQSLEKQNLSSLFLSYLQLPIDGLDVQPVQSTRTYSNYTKEGFSPRKNHNRQFYDSADLDAKQLIHKLLNGQKQFQSEIPTPTLKDISKDYGEKYRRKSIIKDYNVFEKTPFYQKHFNKTLEYDHDLTNLSLYKYPLENLIKNRLNKRSNHDWWEKMIDKIKSKKFQIQDELKQKIVTKHMDKQYERDELEYKNRRARYLNQSYNTLVLDFIDPVHEYKRK